MQNQSYQKKRIAVIATFIKNEKKKKIIYGWASKYSLNLLHVNILMFFFFSALEVFYFWLSFLGECAVFHLCLYIVLRGMWNALF